MEYLTNDLQTIRVGVVDDHLIVTRAFTNLLNSMPPISAVLEAYNGIHLLDQLKTMTELPDILLMDVDMNGMNGIEATRQVTGLFPTIKTIAFSARIDDWPILQMIDAGACAYLSKHVSTAHLEQAIHEVYRKGKYQADLYHLNSASLRKFSKEMEQLTFTENEKCYLQLLCKGYSYSQIATAMNVSIAAVNYYHTCLSTKLNTKSQASMALDALRMGIVSLHQKNDGH